MVCNRCIEAVQEELQKLSITYTNIILGEIELTRSLPDDTKSTLSGNLERRGFEMLEDKNSKIIQKIKALVIDNIRHSKEPSTPYTLKVN